MNKEKRTTRYEDWLEENLDILKEQYSDISEAGFIDFCMEKYTEETGEEI